MNKVAYKIDNLEEYGKFSMWCLNHDIQIMCFPVRNLLLRSTVFIIDIINKMATATNETYCKINNVPVYTPTFFVDNRDEVVVTPATGEKEILKDCELELDKYISFLSKNPSTLTHKEILSFHAKLAFLLNCLNTDE